MKRALGWGALVAVALLAVTGGARAGSEKRPVLRIAVTSGGEVTTSDGRVRCSDRCSARYRRGAVRRLTARADANFIFDRWEDACIGAAPICDVALDRTTSVRAKFVGTPTTLLVSVGGPGTLTSPSGLDCGVPAGACRAQVPYASSVTLKPVPNEDGRFGAWNGDGPCATAGSGPCTLRIESPRTEVAAAFGHSAPQPGAQPLTVTIEPPSGAQVTSQPAGLDCQPACAASFASGTLVMLQMSTLDFWQPACYGDLDRCLLVLNAPTEVSVRLRPPTAPSFTTPKSRLEVTVSGGGLITSSDGAIRCGWSPSAQTSCSEDSGLGPTETRQLRAIKQGQRRFFRWGGFCRGARPKCTVTMTRRSNKAVQPFPVTGLFRRR